MTPLWPNKLAPLYEGNSDDTDLLELIDLTTDKISVYQVCYPALFLQIEHLSGAIHHRSSEPRWPDEDGWWSFIHHHWETLFNGYCNGSNAWQKGVEKCRQIMLPLSYNLSSSARKVATFLTLVLYWNRVDQTSAEFIIFDLFLIFTLSVADIYRVSQREAWLMEGEE